MASHPPDRPQLPATPRAKPAPETASGAGHTALPAGAGLRQDLVLASGARPLPDFELVQRLGRGGFGEVWQAKGPGGFPVALKFIELGGAAGQGELRSLEVIKGIRHPHLLAMFGAWRHGNLLIVAMELGDRTLWQRWDEARNQGQAGIPPRELLEYLREAAKGIDFLNEPRHPGPGGELVGIQHKDIKPQNLLLVGGCVKVADFGLARILEHSAASASGSMTPSYAAPELFHGRTSRWSDQYALAATYCLLRGGRLPFEGSPVEIMARHLMRSPDLTMLTPAERPAVARALAKKPEDRWPTCRAFAEALAAALASPARVATAVRPATALPTVAVARRPAPPHRNRVWVALLGVGGVTALVAAVFVAVLLSGVFFPARHAEPPLAEAPAGVPAPPDGLGPTAAHGAAPRDVPRAQPAPEPVASLGLAPSEDVTLEAGKSALLRVRVERRNCTGPIQVRVEGLPDKVRAEPVTLAADQDVAHVPLAADDGAPEGVRPVRVLVSLGNARSEQQVRVIVRLAPALFLSPVADISLQRRQIRYLGAQVRRRNWKGPVQLSLEGLPGQVRARPVLLPDNADSCVLLLWLAVADVPTTQVVRLLAVGGGRRAQAEFHLTVRPPRSTSELLLEDEEAVRRDPQNPVAYLNRGKTYHDAGDYDRALSDFDETLRLAPRWPSVHDVRGDAYVRKKDYDRAIQAYTRAIELDPSYAAAYADRGRAYARKSPYDKTAFEQAIEDCSRAITIDPNYAYLYLVRGNVYSGRRDYTRAIEDYTEAVRRDPQDAWLSLVRGDAHVARRQYDEAIKDFDEAIRLVPQEAAFYRSRGNAHLQKSLYLRAIDDHTEAIRLEPTSAAYNLRGNAYFARSDYDRALADYNEAIRQDPKGAIFYANRANIYLKKKDPLGALRDCTEAIRIDPKCAHAYRVRADLYDQTGQSERAKADRTTAGQLDLAP